MNSIKTARPAFLVSLVVALSVPVAAQQRTTPASPTTTALASWLALDAPPGEEFHLSDAVMAADHRWHRDAVGNLVLTAGHGRPRRLVACGMDHVGLVVSEITSQGYIRLHSAGNAPTHPLWDQFHEGQQIRVLTRHGSVPGVVAIANAHFARQHRGDTTVVDADHLWVDVGATSRPDAERLGISLLDPVVRDFPVWSYAGNVAGPDASGRVACAAVASAARARARATPTSGETVFVLSAERSFRWLGLDAVMARLGPFDSVTVVAPGAGKNASIEAAVRQSRAAPPPSLATGARRDSVTELAVRTRFPGSFVETVSTSDADSLLAAVQHSAGEHAGAPLWLTLAAPTAHAPHPADSLSRAAALLASLAVIPGVPRHEWRVRDAIRAALPAWARARAVTDSSGDLILAMGPDRDTTVVLAHMDEVSYTVGAIAHDGTVSLRMEGGLIPSAWEGEPALLHFDPGPHGGAVPKALRGIFVPRATATLRRPAMVRAWFGLDSAALVARGVRVGLGVTAYKKAERLAATRFTSRAMDDRAGDTALLLALEHIVPDRLTHKVIFVWSVQEETGLFGARAVAQRMGTSVRHAYAVDTFVSSDTPLESPHFAFAPLGAGAVLRGLDDGFMAPVAECDRIVAIAHSAGVPLQIGVTQGATDATPFMGTGAPGVGLSWPGRYSHSPAEVLDLRDLVSLSRLVAAVAGASAD